MSEFYILSLRWTRSGEEHVTWWGPDNSGYVVSLENAGRYTEEQVRGNPAYYDNRETTIAISCEIADRHARRIVLFDLVDKCVTEATCVDTHVYAPWEEDLDDDGKPYECRECEQRPRHKGPSRLRIMLTKEAP